MKSRRALVLLSVLLAAPSAAQTDLRLIPQPREMHVEGSVSLPNGLTVARPASAEDRFAALDLANALKERGIRVVTGDAGPGPRVVLLRADASTAKSLLRRHSLTLDPAMKEEGYVIIPDGNRLVVIGTTSAGVFYGAQTVKQI
ncbi:MAG TPA: glycoside hydrolase family 20 zincin-like fold domain-containing protein, partial [Gemmatimonadaceae bacterium]|nr:glycoside hydrolase family 20 zincin-like fold domain-containing protein [Gemmatimonadaceae bacterium]